VGEAEHLALGRDGDPHLLLLQRAEPAVRPRPQADLATGDQTAEVLEAELALEVNLGVVVELEHGRAARPVEVFRGLRRVPAQDSSPTGRRSIG
jgi:hypothetical protein